MLGTSIRAIAAGCTGNQMLASEDLLHTANRLVELSTDLIAFPALNRRILIVYIVKLNLYDFNFRIVCQNLLQDFRTIMEGDSHVAYLPLCLQRKSIFIRMTFFIMCIVSCALRMHQIKIKILYSARFQLALKERADIRFCLEKITRQFVRQNIPIPRITAGQTFFPFSLLPWI